MSPDEYVTSVLNARHAMIAEKLADAMMAMKDVGIQLVELAVICGSEHEQWLRNADDHFQEIFDSSRNEFFHHYEAVTKDTDNNSSEVEQLRHLVEMIGSL